MRIIARRKGQEVYLAVEGTLGHVLDFKQGQRRGSLHANSILARGYWEATDDQTPLKRIGELRDVTRTQMPYTRV